jgi:MurNAc alpha-1-phosphate uridylyltransferase
MAIPERAVILAAGLGTRLKWLTDKRPKALMQVGDDPAIVHVIRHLAAHGVREIAINAHHHAGLLMQELGDGSRYGVHLQYSQERELLDSGGGVRQAMMRLPGEGPLLVHNADVLADIDLHALAATLPEGGAALALVPNPAHHPHGDFALRQGRVMAAEVRPFTFAGVSLWDATVLAGYPAGTAFALTQPMRALIGQGRLAGMVHRGSWFDIGRPRDLMQARREQG